MSAAATAMMPTAATYVPLYDGHGNVVSLRDTSTNELAAYTYGPYGETHAAVGSRWASNPFRYSTKFTDAETGLVYYGYRYYQPGTGRWCSRDPIGEEGGTSLLGAFANNPLENIDSFGQFADEPFPDIGPQIDEACYCDHLGLCEWNGHIDFVGRAWGLGLPFGLTGGGSGSAIGIDSKGCIYGVKFAFDFTTAAVLGVGAYSGTAAFDLKLPCVWPVRRGSPASVKMLGLAPGASGLQDLLPLVPKKWKIKPGILTGGIVRAKLEVGLFSTWTDVTVTGFVAIGGGFNGNVTDLVRSGPSRQ